MASLRDEAGEFYERAEHARARATAALAGSSRRRETAEEEPAGPGDIPQIQSREAYVAYLNSGGQPNLVVEGRLGL